MTTHLSVRDDAAQHLQQHSGRATSVEAPAAATHTTSSSQVPRATEEQLGLAQTVAGRLPPDDGSIGRQTGDGKTFFEWIPHASRLAQPPSTPSRPSTSSQRPASRSKRCDENVASRLTPDHHPRPEGQPARVGATTMHKRLVTTSVAAAVALALSGCTGSDGTADASVGFVDGAPVGVAPEASVFEFQTPSYGSEGPLTIRIPEDLLAAAGSDADGLVVTSVIASARPLDSSSYCAVDLALTYSAGGLETAREPAMTEEQHAARYAEALETELLRQFGVRTPEELRALTTGELPEYDAALVEELLPEIEAAVDYSGPYVPTARWSVLDSPSIQDLDPADPSSGTYISDDATVLTRVTSCATSPMDDDSTATVDFPVIIEGKKRTVFATVELSIMKAGTLTVTEAEVDDYTLDANGDWIGG